MIQLDREHVKYVVGVIVAVAVVGFIAYLFRNQLSHFTPDEPSEQITLYYAEWCGHCKRLKPTWDEFKKYVEDNNLPIKIREIEAKQLAQEPEEVQDKISGFPTLIRELTSEVIVGGPPIIELLEKLKATTKPVLAPKDEAATDSNPPAIILYYSNNCPHCQTIFPKWLDFKRYVIDKKLPFQCKEYEASEIPESETSKIKGFPTMLYKNKPAVGSGEILKTLAAFQTSFEDASKTQYNLYYSKSCGYSNALLPTWFKFVNKFDQVYSISTQELSELENQPELKAKITAVPTLIVVNGDGKETTYVGFDDIEKLIKPMLK